MSIKKLVGSTVTNRFVYLCATSITFDLSGEHPRVVEQNTYLGMLTSDEFIAVNAEVPDNAIPEDYVLDGSVAALTEEGAARQGYVPPEPPVVVQPFEISAGQLRNRMPLAAREGMRRNAALPDLIIDPENDGDQIDNPAKIQFCAQLEYEIDRAATINVRSTNVQQLAAGLEWYAPVGWGLTADAIAYAIADVRYEGETNAGLLG